MLNNNDVDNLLKNMAGIERELKAIVSLRLYELQNKYTESESFKEIQDEETRLASINSNERMLQGIAYPEPYKFE